MKREFSFRLRASIFYCAFQLWALLHVEALSSDFTSKPAAQTVATEVTSAAGRSETDCALQCEALRLGCSATAFVPERKLCLLSAAWNADFSAAAAGCSVYRNEWKPFYKTALIDGRKFRVIQQRLKGNLSFQRSWTEYENGFGDDSDFWVGLRMIHELTGRSPKLLRVEALTWSNVLFVCEYSGFSVDDATTNYTMNFSSYLARSSNTTADPLSPLQDMQFSTMDRDNDVHPSSCSQTHGNAGWWFERCSHANPNGLYFKFNATTAGKMQWYGADNSAALQGIRLMLLL